MPISSCESSLCLTLHQAEGIADRAGSRYMNDAAIVEVGTHNELMKCEGEYARLWRMQAEAFL